MIRLFLLIVDTSTREYLNAAHSASQFFFTSRSCKDSRNYSPLTYAMVPKILTWCPILLARHKVRVFYSNFNHPRDLQPFMHESVRAKAVDEWIWSATSQHFQRSPRPVNSIPFQWCIPTQNRFLIPSCKLHATKNENGEETTMPVGQGPPKKKNSMSGRTSDLFTCQRSKNAYTCKKKATYKSNLSLSFTSKNHPSGRLRDANIVTRGNRNTPHSQNLSKSWGRIEPLFLS